MGKNNKFGSFCGACVGRMKMGGITSIGRVVSYHDSQGIGSTIPIPNFTIFMGAINNEFILVVCDIASQTFLYFKFQVISEDFKSVSRQSFQVRVRVQRAACHVRQIFQIFTQNWLMFQLLMFQPKVGILDRSAKSEWVIPTLQGKP